MCVEVCVEEDYKPIQGRRGGWVGVAGGGGVGGWLLCEVLLTACDRLRLAK